MLNELRRFLADERGGALEYAFVSTLATLAGVALLLFMHGDKADFTSNILGKISGAIDQSAISPR